MSLKSLPSLSQPCTCAHAEENRAVSTSKLNLFAETVRTVAELLGLKVELSGLGGLHHNTLKNAWYGRSMKPAKVAELYKQLIREIESRTVLVGNQNGKPVTKLTPAAEEAKRRLGSEDEFKELAEQHGEKSSSKPLVQNSINRGTSDPFREGLIAATDPCPPFQVMPFPQLLGLGYTAQQIWDASDWVDLAIASEEGSPMFREHHWLPPEVGMAVAARDDWSMLCLIDSAMQLWGYSFMTALLPVYFEKTIKGDYHEPDVRFEHTVPIVPQTDPLNIIVFGVDTHPTLWRDPKCLDALGSIWLVKRLLDFQNKVCTARNYRVGQIAALGVTEKGRQMCKMAGMTKIGSFVRDSVVNDVYRLIPDPL